MTWRPVIGFEGVYEFAGSGAVRRCSDGRPLKACLTNRGYYAYYLQDSRAKRRVVLVHRLVALFNVPNPENKPEVNHIDGIKTNNAPSNLEWVTHAENMAHAGRMGLMVCDVGPGERSPSAKLNDAAVRDIRSRHKAGESQAALSRAFGVAKGTIGFIVRRATWAHIE